MRRFLLVAVLLGACSCSGGDDPIPPVFRVRSPLLFTFEGQRSGVSVEVDGRARFSVIDAGGRPRGTGVAEQAGEYEIEFDPSELSEHGSELEVVAISDSGGRARGTITVRHGALGLEVLDEELQAAALLSDQRVAVLSTRGLLLQASEGSTEFEGPLTTRGAARTALTAGPDGDLFAAGQDDVVLHYDSSGELCETIELLPTQTDGGDAPPSEVSDLASQFGAGGPEVMASHDLGFSGFAFTGRPCAQDGCAEVDDCPLDVTTGFSTGTCLTSDAAADFRATAVAMDADRAYTGGYTLNVRSLTAGTNVCVDLQVPGAASEAIRDIAVSTSSVWVALARGISRAARDFDVGSGVARPSVDRYGEGRAAGDGLDELPSNEIRALTAVAAGEGATTDGVWFGTDTGLGRILRDGSTSEVAWVSGLSLPGRRVVAILAPPDDPGLLWVATDGGLARLFLPAEEPE
jgi:hypothetical protein